MKTIGELLNFALKSYADLPAMRWLEKKEIRERSYRELGEDISAVRNGLAEGGFHRDHIALIGTSSVEWVTAYFAAATGENAAVPLDAGLPAEDLLDDASLLIAVERPVLEQKHVPLVEEVPRIHEVLDGFARSCRELAARICVFQIVVPALPDRLVRRCV